MKQHPVIERQHPIFSPIAFTATIILIAGMALVIFLTGGRMFSPGDLSNQNLSGTEIGGFFTHAQFGDDCLQCHAPFRGIEFARCENCHLNIRHQRQSQIGLHGNFDNVTDCISCHHEHQGAEYDLASASVQDFDHEQTGFSLIQHAQDYAGTSLSCTTCHTDQSDFSQNSTPCTDCHTAEAPDFMAVHTTAFGTDCIACHDGKDTLAQFTVEDHAQTFALTGQHLKVTCESCHNAGIFEGTSPDCVACHAEPDKHLGLFGTDCVACHTTDGWTPATLDPTLFDHFQSTGFALAKHLTNYDQTPFVCATCHTAARFEFAPSQCIDCHGQAEPAFISDHIAQFGKNCLSCHDGADRMIGFDHQTVFPLEGEHALIECANCHVDRVFAGTPRQCVQCHQEPTIHQGLFGTDCANCHTPTAWTPARLIHHTFPLDHAGQGEIPCATCHASTFTQYSCDSCHARSEMEEEHLKEDIPLEELPNCIRCHPTGLKDETDD